MELLYHVCLLGSILLSCFFLQKTLLNYPIEDSSFHIFLYSGLIFLGAPIAETIYNSLHFLIHNKQLWQYQLYPINNGDTSWLASIIWPIYGLNMYFIFKKISSFHYNRYIKYILSGLIIGIEGPIWEIIVNAIFLIFFKTYVFYYLPSDLWHLSSVQAIPVYATCGILAFYIFNVSENLKNKYIVVGTWAGAIISLKLLSSFLP